MIELARQYAKLKGTKVISHRVDGDSIIFVLGSGPKLTMTESELRQAVMQSAPSAASTPPPDVAASTPQGTGKQPAADSQPKAKAKAKAKQTAP